MNYRFDRRGYLSDPRDPQATPPREIHLIPVAGGEPRLLTELGVDAGGLAWSPDSRRLAFTADASQRDEHSYERSDLWTVDLDGTVDRFTDDEYNYSSPAWSPDGSRIVVRGNEGLDVIIREGRDRGSSTELLMFDAADGRRIGNLTAEWDLIPGSATWSPDGGLVYFSAGIGGNTHLFRVPAGGGAVEQVSAGDRRLGGLSFSADLTRVAFTATDPVHPRDIWVVPMDGGDETRITDVNGALLADLDLAMPDRLLFRSPDGTEVEGWILPGRGYGEGGGGAAARGAGANGFPMILLMHGGPHGAYGNDFSFDRQLLAAQGYMVLYTNPRASTGYGEAFRWGTWGGWGFNDYDDVMAGVDHAIANYDIDTARMGVTGYSYGGYLTNWVITQTDRFAAAVAGAGISNWVSDYGVAGHPAHQGERVLRAALGRARTRESAALVSADLREGGDDAHDVRPRRIGLPGADRRSGTDVRGASQAAGPPPGFVRYPESYHGGWTPWRTMHRTWVQLEWWSEWLSKRPASE